MSRRPIPSSLTLTLLLPLLSACPDAAAGGTDSAGATVVDAGSADAGAADRPAGDAAGVDRSAVDAGVARDAALADGAGAVDRVAADLQQRDVTAPADAAVAGAIYVDGQLGTDCTASAPGARACGAGVERAFRTLTGAAAVAAPGDLVLVRGGSYGETLRPASSGAPGAPITFRGYAGEEAAISGAALEPGIDISDRAHIVIEGLTVSGVRRWLYALNTHDCVLRGNTFRQALDSGGSSKTGLFFQEATRNRILDNTVDDSTQDNLSLVRSDRNLVQGNSFRRAAHTLWTIKCGSYNVLRGNDFHNAVQKIGEIYDCDGVGFDHELTLADATKHNLVERNVFSYTASSGDSSPYAGIQYAGQEGIIRFNRFHSTVGPGLSMTLYGGEAEHNTDNRVYNNVFFRTDFAGVEISGSQSYSFGGNLFKNNILTRSVFVANDTRWDWYTGELAGKPVQLLTGRTDGFLFDTNCFYNDHADELYLITYGSRTSSSNPAPETLSWWQANHPELFANNLEVDPAYEDEAQHDFHLSTQSLLIDAGTFLTTTAVAGAGTSLQVADARYFYDGFGIPGEQGDLIQLEGGAETARAVQVDYASNTLTLDAALSWTAGQGVSLAYSGEAPDLGAFETP